MKLVCYVSDKPVTVGIIEEKISTACAALTLKQRIVFPAVSGVTVMLSCEV
jgi:hypothetical protein